MHYEELHRDSLNDFLELKLSVREFFLFLQDITRPADKMDLRCTPSAVHVQGNRYLISLENK